MDEIKITRYRLTFGKFDLFRFIGHLDLQKLWERALRRSGLPVRYSEGYTQKARINIASALPLGYTSSGELIDFWLNEDLPTDHVKSKLLTNLPEKLSILKIDTVSNKLPSLQSSLVSSEYILWPLEHILHEDLVLRIEGFNQTDYILHEHRGKIFDLRKEILDLSCNLAENQPQLIITIDSRPGAKARPTDVLEQIGYKANQWMVERKKINLSSP